MIKLFFILLIFLPAFLNAQPSWSIVEDDTSYNKSRVTDKALFRDSVILVSGFVNDVSCRYHKLFAYNLNGEKLWNIPSVCDVIATDSNFIYTAGYDIGADDVGNDEQLVVSKYDKDGAEIFSLRLSSSNLIDRYIQHGGNYYPTGINISEDGTILVSFDKSICKCDIAGTKIQEYIVTLPDIEGIISLSPVSYLIYTQNNIYKSDSSFVLSDSISFSGSISKMLLKNDTMYVLFESSLVRLDTSLVAIDVLMETSSGFQDMEFYNNQLWIQMNDPDSIRLLKVTDKSTADTLSFELLLQVKGFIVSDDFYTFAGNSFTDQIGLYTYIAPDLGGAATNLPDIELEALTIDSILIDYIVWLGDSIPTGYRFNTQITIKNNGMDTIRSFAVFSGLMGSFNCSRNFYYEKFTGQEILPGESQTVKLRRLYQEGINNTELCFQSLAPNSALETMTGNNILCKTVTVTGIDEKEHTSVTVYPNPVKDYLRIDHAAIIQQVDVLDIKGTKMFSVFPMERNARIDTRSLQKGMYLVVLKTEDFVYRKKIIKSD